MPKNESDTYDDGKCLNEVIKSNKKRKPRKKVTKKNKPNRNTQQTPPNPTPVRDEAS